MTADRRTMLSFLGLAGATAVGMETFTTANAEGGARAVRTAFDAERFARAFEKIAAGIRDGSIETCNFSLNAELKPNTIADIYDLRFQFRQDLDAV